MPERIRAPLLCFCLLLSSIGYAEPTAHVELELLAIDPADRAELPLFAPIHGRIAYRSDAPVRLVLRPYRNGQPVLPGVSYSGSPHYPEPEGEGIAWFAFGEAQQIDEIRALATDNWGNEFARASIRHSVRWRAGVSKPQPAGWVEPLMQQRKALSEAQQPGDDGSGWLVTGFIQLLFMAVPLSVVLQVFALMLLRGWHGGLARLSAVAMGALWLFVIVTGIAGSNLSPIWLVFLSPLFVLLLGALLAHHWLQRRQAAER